MYALTLNILPESHSLRYIKKKISDVCIQRGVMISCLFHTRTSTRLPISGEKCYVSRYGRSSLVDWLLAFTSSIAKIENTILTRALEGGILCPQCFSQISKKTAARRQIWGTCAQLKNTPCLQILTSQVKSSGSQVRSESDVHSGTGFKLAVRAVGTVLVLTFSNFQHEVLE